MMTHHSTHKSCNRHGVAAPEWFCILGALVLGCLAAWSTLGESVSQYTQTTAESVASPSLLVDHPAFRLDDSDQDQASQDGSKPHGNNGLGNGEDPQPAGNPPVNDGSGTGPGNPGNRGGS
ncbi:MAG: hypothetical protein ABFD16_31375 [Thermoguttaceae bacterium]|jgi:hypothetical protein